MSLLLLSVSLSGCTWLQDLMDRTVSKPTPATIYAASVEAFNVCTSNNRYCDPTQAVGPPDDNHVSLGAKGGYIIATMSSEFVDGPGVDLRIYEEGRAYGGVDEPFDVYISSDGFLFLWIQVADSVKNDLKKPYTSIDIAGSFGSYRYVKIVDRSTQSSSSIGTPGSDIDAIEALWTP